MDGVTPVASGLTMIALFPDLPHRPKRLKLNPRFQPCAAQVGDELYPNGIFEFNVSRLWDFVRAHAERFAIEFVAIEDISDYGGNERLNQATIQGADCLALSSWSKSRPTAST
jgi:hypothetical protein